jgi:hypothetical protein
VVAVVEPDVVRAALVAALEAPHAMFWRFDIRPLTATALSGRAGRWNVRVGEPLGVRPLLGPDGYQVQVPGAPPDNGW